METSETDPPCSLPFRLAAYGLLGLYWIGLFTLTHIPRLTPPPELPINDKLSHFLGYGLLTVLFMMARATSVPLRAAVYLQTFVILAVYGIFDELSQILAGRSCELMDWVADLAGIACGLVGIAVISALWQYSRKQRTCEPTI